ncbi:MRPS18C isoform 4 [Pan troglodytes]|uniref:Mitochondrial ribosomal protein S18C n=4 Tax=Homininae TaxID=207598 RepID=D6RE70_HUMAN|nr:small ribosomal subunit protein bS18m isoform 4 [Homo sapiens]XP_034814440.1 28S ribosomal protein S18c, mitochondrial isoform X3 [Pan paniscus]XP_054538863.1 28S ribosomal protein S18c, mitochondrial isoform X5 [Pan troglodytes]KAI2534925.1 mitochondrial ribosomal protein S18C [Homo sapiens]KAI4026023.1 mitochondrial ribosomal protein S18C [Homo sapiens]PNI83084.1 MRPS18C isoform 4 [Pan troglodytes]|eukprot:NP_001284699.1 28S ribosomal protein S18c, mitochondrial isoform 4 [Homo sapiens]
MAAVVAVCGGLGRKKLTHLVTAAVSLTHPGTHTVLWRRGCSQQVSSNEDLVFVGRNRKKSQKQLRELK